MKVRFLGAHNTESRSSKMAALVVDDILALDAGGLTSSLSFRSQLKLRALLLTHQHYDHIRDLPALAMSLFAREGSLLVCTTLPVANALKKCLFDGSLYPNFFEPRQGRRVLTLDIIDPHQTKRVLGYSIIAVPVIHSVAAVGYQITAEHGESLFYTGDTGPGLYESWRHVSPHLMVIEVTVSNRYEESARESGHLTPGLLKSELQTFKQLKGYLPRVITVHMNPELEAEIALELGLVATELGADISMAREGMQVDLPEP